MSYSVKVVADSIGPHGARLTTLVATFPRFILAELNTHRMLSRNSASSRAIPPERLIERVLSDPFVPETFNRRVKGMGVGEKMQTEEQFRCEEQWLFARDAAVDAATRLNAIGVDKSRVNRLLEPFLWHTALVSATEWSNFFALRQPMNDDPVPQLNHGAQPEFQIVARKMRDAMRESTPRELDYGEWHLPFVDQIGTTLAGHEDYWPLVSAGRCFVVSYDRLDEIMGEDDEDSYKRADRGKLVGHWSPLEHPAACCKPARGGKFGLSHDDWFGNFRGWRQLRKFYAGEEDFQKLLDRASAT